MELSGHPDELLSDEIEFVSSCGPPYLHSPVFTQQFSFMEPVNLAGTIVFLFIILLFLFYSFYPWYPPPSLLSHYTLEYKSTQYLQLQEIFDAINAGPVSHLNLTRSMLIIEFI